IGYVFYAAVGYFAIVPVIIGTLFPKIPWAVRIPILTFYAITSVFFLFMATGRLFVVMPWATMAFGLMFLSNWPSKSKVILTLVLGVVFPLVLAIGDAARGLRRASDATFGERWNVLTGWEQIFSRGSFVDQTMGRLFSTGGHSLITLTPQDIPYMD